MKSQRDDFTEDCFASSSNQHYTKECALTYLNEVTSRFHDQPERLANFEKAMKDVKDIIAAYRAKPDSDYVRFKGLLQDASTTVKAILEGHDDLILGYNSFLPESFRAREADVSEKESATAKKNTVEYQDALNFVKKARTRDDKIYESFLRIMSKYEQKLINVDEVHNEVLAVFADHKDLQEGFSIFMPVSEEPSFTFQDLDTNQHGMEVSKKQKQHLEEIKPARTKAERFVAVNCADGEAEKIQRQGINFFEKVQERLSCPVSYLAFLKHFYYYSVEKIEKHKLESMVEAMIGKYPDLMLEFSFYLKICENIYGFSRQVAEKNRDQREHKLEAGRYGDRNQEKYMFKTIQELDLSKCKKCTPSYQLLPEDYQLPSTTNRTEHELQVLNDGWVSVPSGTDRYSTNNRHTTQHEKLMFQREDERFELDMLLNWFKSASYYAEELLKGTNEDEIGKGKQIHFLRCVELLYGGHALDVLDTFRKDPAHALPVILVRLNQKVEELTEYHSDLNRTWADVCAKNKRHKRKRMQIEDDVPPDADV